MVPVVLLGSLAAAPTGTRRLAAGGGDRPDLDRRRARGRSGGRGPPGGGPRPAVRGCSCWCSPSGWRVRRAAGGARVGGRTGERLSEATGGERPLPRPGWGSAASRARARSNRAMRSLGVGEAGGGRRSRASSLLPFVRRIVWRQYRFYDDTTVSRNSRICIVRRLWGYRWTHMPVVALTDLQPAPAERRARSRRSAPSELFWLLLYLAAPRTRRRRTTGSGWRAEPAGARRAACGRASGASPARASRSCSCSGSAAARSTSPSRARFIDGIDEAAAAPDAPVRPGERAAGGDRGGAPRAWACCARTPTCARPTGSCCATRGRSSPTDWEREGRAQVQAAIARVARAPGARRQPASPPSPAGTSLRRYLPMVEAAEAPRRGRRHAALPRRRGPPDQAARRAAARRGPARRATTWPKRRAEAEAAGPAAQAARRPTRVLIVALLTNSSLSVGDLVEELKLSQPTISVHVRQLREAGLLEVRRDGGRTLYSTSPQRVEALLDEARSALRTHLRVVMWEPPASVVEAANSTRFARDHGLASHAELLRALARGSRPGSGTPGRATCRWPSTSRTTSCSTSRAGPSGRAGSSGGRLNLVESCVHRHARGRAGRPRGRRGRDRGRR